MKKTISVIITISLVSSMSVTSAFADNRDVSLLNPFLVPVVILSAVATTVSTIVQAPFVYDHRGYTEPRQAVIYEQPRYYSQPRYFGRPYYAPRYSEYR